MAHSQALLLDDFEARGGSHYGPQWEGFTDRVMGGRSTMSAGIAGTGDGAVLRMTGTVSLENNGGFVQVRLPLIRDGAALDASEYTGVAVTIRGTGPAFALHVRTPRNNLPWNYYAAELPVEAEWRRIEIPFSQFQAEGMLFRSGLDTSRLRSIAVVAAKKAGAVDVEIDRVELYR
jgi:hypothetical protein